MARRIVNRMDKRAEHEAWERRHGDEEREDEEEGDEEEGDEDEEEGDEEGEDEEADEDEGEADEAGDDEEEAPKKKKPAKPKAKPKAKPRTRAVKTTRMRVVWGVFNNSHQMVASYEYPRKQDAEAHAAKLMSEKRSTHFIQPVKEPIEEKKES